MPDLAPYDVTFGTSSLHIKYTAKLSLPDAVPIAERRKAVSTGFYWSAPYADAPAVIEWARQHGKTVDPAVAEFADGLWMRELDAMAASTAASIPTRDHTPVTGLTTTMLSTQEVVVTAAARAWVQSHLTDKQTHRAILVADVPGLGKTIEALASLRITALPSKRAVIVCPTSLTENWKAEMGQHFATDTFHPWTAQGQTPTAVPVDVNAVIIGWDVLTHWADTLVKWKPDAVVADEGHYAKSGRLRTKKETVVVRDEEKNVVRDEQGNLQMVDVQKKVSGSARASGLLTLRSAVVKQHGLVMALTGTPIVNRPLELLPLLDFIDVLHLFGGSGGFKGRFCDPQTKSIGGGRETVDHSGASHLLELNARLAASGHYARRTKQGMVRDGVMKPKIVDGVDCFDFITRPNPWVIDVPAAEMVEYRAAETDSADFFATRAAEIARDLRSGINTVRVQNKVAAEGHKHLTRLTELRKLAAIVKVPHVIAKVQEMVAKGEKVVIAAHHREVVDAYAYAFTGLKIQGTMGVKKIEEAKRLFNDTPITEHPVIVLSVEAGKTGHTLCKQHLAGVGKSCAYMVFAEQVWTPGDATQAQDRIWRIGQDREVRIINALLRDTIDFQVFGLRAKKSKVVNAAVDAVEPNQMANADNERESQGAIAQELARRGHATLV